MGKSNITPHNPFRKYRYRYKLYNHQLKEKRKNQIFLRITPFNSIDIDIEDMCFFFYLFKCFLNRRNIFTKKKKKKNISFLLYFYWKKE